jgi:YggT family protein
MFIVGNLIEGLALVLRILLDTYWWIVLARVIVSWVQADPYNPIVRFLHAATDPLLYRVRRLLPMSYGGIDFSPLVVMLAIYFLQVALVRSLYRLSMSFQ